MPISLKCLLTVLTALGGLGLLTRAAAEPAPAKRVALVFDDGPVPANAGPLLALLAVSGIVALDALGAAKAFVAR